MKFIAFQIFAFCFALPLVGKTVVTYSFGDVGPANTLLSTDGWVGEDIGDWIVGDRHGTLYGRNNDGWDNTITRANDARFSFSIPANTAQLNIEITASTVSGSFWQAGIVNTGIGNTAAFGVGGSFAEGVGNVFILDGKSRRVGETNTVGGSPAIIRTFRLEYNIAEGTADLFQDDQQIADDLPIASTLGDLQKMDALYLRTSSKFAGPATIRIETVPSGQKKLIFPFLGG